MSYSEIIAVEHAGRSAMAWVPEGYDGRTHLRTLLGAALPALAILGTAIAVLLAVW